HGGLGPGLHGPIGCRTRRFWLLPFSDSGRMVPAKAPTGGAFHRSHCEGWQNRGTPRLVLRSDLSCPARAATISPGRLIVLYPRWRMAGGWPIWTFLPNRWQISLFVPEGESVNVASQGCPGNRQWEAPRRLARRAGAGDAGLCLGHALPQFGNGGDPKRR